MSNIFFIFIFLTIFCGIMVLLADTPIIAILCLIGCFINSAILLLLLGFDFFALVFVIIYLSVISVLFLFILIVLNLSYNVFSAWIKYCFILGSLIFVSGIFLNMGIFTDIQLIINLAPVTVPHINLGINYLNSVELIAMFLYTDYLIYLVLGGIFLFFILIGAVLIMQDYRPKFF